MLGSCPSPPLSTMPHFLSLFPFLSFVFFIHSEPTTLSGLGVQPWSRQTWPLSSESSSLLEIQIFRVQDSKGSGGGRTQCCEIIENECQRHER